MGLNEQATAYISGKDDPGKRRVFDHAGLRVMAASPEHVFAMKALAARTRDVDDLRLLAGMIGVETAEAALQICSDFYPDEPIPPRTTVWTTSVITVSSKTSARTALIGRISSTNC